MSTERSWRPGDPDRRRTHRSLLELTGTTAEEHLPSGHEVEAHAERRVGPVVAEVPPPPRWKASLRRVSRRLREVNRELRVRSRRET